MLLAIADAHKGARAREQHSCSLLQCLLLLTGSEIKNATKNKEPHSG